MHNKLITESASNGTGKCGILPGEIKAQFPFLLRVSGECFRVYRTIVLEPHLDSVRKEMKALQKDRN